MKKSQRIIKGVISASLAMGLAATAVAPNALAVTQPEADTPLAKDKLEKLSVKGIERLDNGVKFDLGNKDAYIRLFADDLAKVSILEKGKEEYTSRGIAKKDWKTPRFTAKDKGNVYELRTKELIIHIKKDTFGVKFMDHKGNVINEDYMDNGSTSGYENGKPYVYKKTDKNEAFYGFGEQAGLNLNQRGESIGMWNTDAYAYDKDTKYIYTTIPFFIGLKNEKAYGILFDNTHRSYYEMASESDDYYYFYANGGDLTYYFMNGPEVSDVIDRYTDLTGKQELPPEWSMGLQQSKWEYTADDIVNVAKTYRDKKIPLDTMVFDIDYMDGFRVFTWNQQFKDAVKKVKSMDGFHTVAINDPAVKQDENNSTYQEGTKNDYWAKNADGTPFIGPVWPGDSAFPDFSKEEVRQWWAQKHNVLFDAGIDGIWNDMNEPAVFRDDAQHNHTMPLDAYFGYDNDKILHTEYHNMYGHDEADATHRAFSMHKPNERPFVLTRDMYAGTQRYSALWTGDTVSTWEHLQMSLPSHMNIGMSGVANVGTDIGGFAQRPTAEMYARWIQIGSLYPFARIHYDSDAKATVKQGQEPWAFGPEIEKISKKYIEQRYKLLPYLYNAFQDASETGKPVQQPLVYQFQEDENTYNIADQFMFGDSLMVAPVVKEGQTSRSVYLPEGHKWVDYVSGKEYEGGRTINVSGQLDEMPMFVKKDSMIPTRDVQQHTGEKPLENLVLDTYLDKKAEYSFYEDDAATLDHSKKGEFNETKFTVERKGKHNVTFSQKKLAANYKDTKLEQYTLKLHNAENPRKVAAGMKKYKAVNTMDKMTNASRTYFFDEKTKTLYVNIPAGEKRDVQIR
ncbi:DUF4968 domain-containing protein [Bacillus sp. FJAT-42376]|uniref:glycoside hydrolase family 31 protein n=1 Tax=Bacillus sp. FJAT-42376 TaxID=2014076 RepID=UPI000F516CFD|nr:glycoside hydrolase family 31 protein [Bacillus sp. FJAT-42376]AZB42001.1 DUF4968 domain-containing protein [Bacillus sp. FJAT-42376]